MKLHRLLEKLPKGLHYKVDGSIDIDIKGVESDSRKINEGDLFIAVKGLTVDGHDFISKAIERKAAAVIIDQDDISLPDNTISIIVKNTSESIGHIVSAFYDYPSRKLKLIGVTGTNGKSTIVTLLYNLFRELGQNVGLISTIENRINEKVIPAKFTTPDAITLNRLLVDMVNSECEYAFMEVSSHAIKQGRINGQEYSGAIFTNLTHDHLDYHRDFKEYLYTKKELFDNLGEEAFALTNVDDKNGEVMVQNCIANKYRYSLRTLVDYKAKQIRSDIDGMLLSINGEEVYSRLVGAFNAYNVLTVYATAKILEMNRSETLRLISGLKSAEGRFDVVRVEGSGKIGIIDYAHTPDALKNVLDTLKNIKGEKEIVTVVGCGGDRDTEKRPVMASIAARYSTKVILTSDNPRSENPDTIIDEMYVGLEKEQMNHVLKITNRKEAIKTAVMIANNDAIILVAGKGHENTQEIKGKKFPFNDKLVLKAFLREE